MDRNIINIVIGVLFCSWSYSQVPVVVSNTVSTGSGTSTTVDMPSTKPDGDLYIVFGFKDDDPEFTLPTPAADHWTEIASVENGSQVRIMAWHFVSSSEPASYTVTHDNEVTVFVVCRITGANTGDPIELPATVSSTGANSVVTHFNTVNNNALILASVAVDRNDVTAIPTGGIAPVSYSSISFGGSGGANDVGYGVAEGSLATA